MWQVRKQTTRKNEQKKRQTNKRQERHADWTERQSFQNKKKQDDILSKYCKSKKKKNAVIC